MSTYVIGDVHGHYDTLQILVQKLPQDAKLIFVGDLIDRGPKSAQVVKFVRHGGHSCVMGNHEDMMVHYGISFLKVYPKTTNPSYLHNWYNNGGAATLFSYGLIKYDIEKGIECAQEDAKLEQFIDDLEWMKKLPLYIELDTKHLSQKPVVISHACIGHVWKFRNDKSNQETFREYVLWNRKQPPPNMPIFNIFGHTPIDFYIEIGENHVNVDRGCYRNSYGYGELAAYCIETCEVVSVNRRLEV